ncbi:metal-dependent hydrolase family protein [Nakamurella endophytica]|uniref:Hydrolase n=1 Tax=Nakamurella endophytica TaxID=1748367 RepID=A0A917WEC3_9ACTN|nr:amidohydrolase family protein [Nakamurella endophytica]GGL96735.1 hydrolase [Nakamurella endophytica]
MSRTVFTGGTVYDGTTSLPAVGDVVVEDGRVVEVGTDLDGDEAVDCTGAYVSPGFFDCHVHVTMERPNVLQTIATPFSLQFYLAAANLKKTLDVGITTVRDAGGADQGVKEAVSRGLIPGPRMQIAIIMLSQTGGHGDDWEICGAPAPFFVPHPGRPSGVVDGPLEVRRRVRELIRAGADVIKVATTGGVLSPRDDPRHPHFRDDEIAEMVAEATAAGLHVMAHAQGAGGIKAALRNGVRSIEHGIFLDDEAIDMMLQRGAWLVPTLHAPRAVLAAADEGMPLPQAVVDKARSVSDAHRDSVRRAHEAGVRIAMGTDCGVGLHGTNLDELELMTGTGMSPLEALHATTGSAAELLDVAQDRGTLAPGRRADLVVVDGDPGDVTGLAGRVRAVYLDGVRVGGREA